MKNLEVRKSQQQEIEQILNETFTNTAYCDEDIGQFINDGSGNYQEMFGKSEKVQRRETLFSNPSIVSKASKSSSRKRSESGSQYGKAFGESFDDIEDTPYKNNGQQRQLDQQSQVFSEEDKNSSMETSEPEKGPEIGWQVSVQPQQFKKLNAYYQKYQEKLNPVEIRERYPYFVVSQPVYSISKTYHEDTFQYNTIKNINIQCMDVGFCRIADNYKIAIGTDDGRVALFQKTYTKPVNIFEAFPVKTKTKGKTMEEPKSKVTSIKWSQNLQYLAVSSSRNQLKVYQFKQAITIEDNNILRLFKEPIELFSLTGKELKRPVSNIRFLTELPLSILLQNEDNDIEILEYKLHIMNYRPYLSQLPLKFNDVYQVQLVDFFLDLNKENKSSKISSLINQGQKMAVIPSNKGKEYECGTILAVGSDQYVTIALLKPYFEVIMVYDKEKHGKNIKKEGYAHISFRKQPLGILIVWDKYAQLLNIQITSLSPLQSNIRSMGSQLMPETTLLAGLVTDTLVYQLSQSGIKIYAVGNFGEEKDSSKYKESIYDHNINFYELPSGPQILQQLTQKIPTLGLLQLLQSYIKVCNGELFVTTNTSLFSVRIEKFQQFIRNTIQNLNNWKIGLQLLYDGYLGKYKSFDNMTKEIVIKNLHEYSIKYINFLLLVIGNSNALESNEESLWTQQLTFLINILIETEQFEHLLNKILPKLESSNLSRYIRSIQPFIMLHKLSKITPLGLELFYRSLPNEEIIKILLIANVVPEQNEVDLPHMINQTVLSNSMYEEMVAVNVSFGDYFTPFAVLVSYYEAIDSAKVIRPKNDLQVLTELKIKSKDSQRSQKSSHDQKESENPEKLKKKQRLRELIVYLTYRIFNKINTNEDCPPHCSMNEKRKITNKHKEFLQVFLPLFQSSIIPILLESPDEQLSLFESILPQMFRSQSLQLINDIDNKHFNTDLMTDIAMGIPIGRIANLKAYWICLISLYNRSVIKMEVFMGLRYLISSQDGSGKEKINEETPNKIGKIRKKNSKLVSGLQRFIRQTVALSGVKISQQFSKLSSQLLEQFYNELLSSESTHVGLLIIVAIILGSGFYIKVILAMMAHNEYPSNGRKGELRAFENAYSVYDFINQVISKFSKGQKEELKNILYENVEYYIQLDCERLCALIITHYLADVDKFVSFNTNSNSLLRNTYMGVVVGEVLSPKSKSFISVNEYLLIKLIEGLLHRLQSPEIQSLKIEIFQPNSQWMLSLRLKFLRLLAITGRQHEILSELQKENYPLDSSLQICRKYGVIDAEAYLLVKSGGEGEIASAIRLYFQLIAQKVKLLTPQNLGGFKQYFISIIRQCIKVCQNLHVAPDHFNEEWFLISEELYQLKINIYRILVAFTGDLLCDIIDKQIYPILAEKIVRKQNSDGIVDYLKDNIGVLDLIFIRALLHEIIKNYSFQKVMFLLAQQTYIESEIRERRKITVEAAKGFKTQCICYLCRQENGIVIHYNNCGHQIHPSCGQDVKVCIVCTCRLDKMIEKQFDLIRKIKPQLYGKEAQIEPLDGQAKDKKRRELIMEGHQKYDKHKVDVEYF